MPNVNPWGVAAVVAATIAFFATWSFASRQSTVVRLGVFAGFAALSMPGVLFTIYYLHVFPEREWFFTLRSWPGSEFLAVFVGCAAGSLAAFLPKLLLGVPAFLVIAFTAIPYLKPVIGPLDESVVGNVWKDGVCLQSTPSTCGPASVCTILAALGEPVAERELLREAYSYSGGTEAWYLARSMRRRGITPSFDFTSGFDRTGAFPAMVGVRIGGYGHFIAVLSVEGDTIEFADPLGGRETMSLAEFERRYVLTGFRLSARK